MRLNVQVPAPKPCVGNDLGDIRDVWIVVIGARIPSLCLPDARASRCGCWADATLL
jgi:hypothetical protein